MDCFSRASELKPDNPDALGYLAVSCYETGDYKKSLDSAVKALELKPDETWIVGYALLSSALSRHTDKAIEYMEKISSLDPSGNELSRVLYNLNNFLKKNPSREDLEVIKSRLQNSFKTMKQCRYPEFVEWYMNKLVYADLLRNSLLTHAQKHACI